MKTDKKSIKNIKQEEALKSLRNHPRPMIVLATGVGKSRIAIERAKEIVSKNPNASILISVPTEKLRDEDWKDEFHKWGAISIWKNNVVRSCYVSMNKIKGQTFDLLIMDEQHNITESNSVFFENNRVKQAIGLTATPTEDKDKQKILKDLGFEVVYQISLDEAVELGLVSPYEIIVVEVEPDDKDKYVQAGSKEKPFMQTEKRQYDYLTSCISRLMFSSNPAHKKTLTFKILDRMRFIYNFKAKSEAAQWLLANLISKEERTLIFTGSIEQADLLCKHSYHSKSKSSKSLDDFRAKKINRLSCVQALNQGVNIDEIHNALIVQVNSKELHLVQRIGRALRKSEGHSARVYIVGALGTKDMDWISNALENFDKSKIQYVRFENIINGNVKL